MNDYLETENRWAERALPYTDESEAVISAWTTDEYTAEQAAMMARAYGNRYEVDTILRLLRSQLREAAMTTADNDVLIQSVLDNGVAELINAGTTDAGLDAYVVAAEAGNGGPIPGLREELHRLRDAQPVFWRDRWIDPGDPFCPTALRYEHRVFVAGPAGVAPRIGNFGGDYVQPDESGCPCAHRGVEDPEWRRRVDAAKAKIRVEDL
jgi:hypothetical protein